MALLASGVRVLSVSALWETFSQKIPHSEINEDWLTKLDLRQRDPVVRRMKRLLDVIISCLGLVIGIPILFLACIAIFLESGFPLFFSQKRSGYLNRPYILYKLRTMIPNSERRGLNGLLRKIIGLPMWAGFCAVQGLMKFLSFGM